MGGIPSWAWLDIGYVLLTLTFLVLVLRHRRRPLQVVPASPVGKGQLLYLGLLWWLVAGNFARAIVAFRPERLVTEGVIYVVALACTLVVILSSDPASPAVNRATSGQSAALANSVGRNDRRGTGRGGAFDCGRLGDCADDLRGSVRRSCQPAHSVRSACDHQPPGDSLEGIPPGAGPRQQKRGARVRERLTVPVPVCRAPFRQDMGGSHERPGRRLRTRRTTARPVVGGEVLQVAASSAADSYRCSGSRAIAFMMISSASDGNPGSSRRGRRGSAPRGNRRGPAE